LDTAKIDQNMINTIRQNSNLSQCAITWFDSRILRDLWSFGS